MFEVLDASDWEAVAVVETGRRPKEWVVEPAMRRRALFKSAVHHSGEVAVERVASEVGKLLGIPTADTALALRHGIQGILSFSVVSGTESLIDGGDLLIARDASFDRTHARVHAFQLVREVLPPELLGPFVDLLLLDAVIGNSDRHQDNWSIIQAPPALTKLAPSYDHGSSLGRDWAEANLVGMLPAALDQYVKNGRSRVGWREGETVTRLRHIDLLVRVAEAHPDLVATSVGRLHGVEKDQADAIVDAISDTFASLGRRNLMKELLWRRIAQIKARFNVDA